MSGMNERGYCYPAMGLILLDIAALPQYCYGKRYDSQAYGCLFTPALMPESAWMALPIYVVSHFPNKVRMSECVPND